jgi:hypothetical protein
MLIFLFLLNSVAVSLTDLDTEFHLILPDEIPTNLLNSDEMPSLNSSVITSQKIKGVNDKNDILLSKLALTSEGDHLKNKNVQIGQNDYLILKPIGDGAEGAVYTAKGPNDTAVAIKAILDIDDAKETYNNEVFVLKKLNRLLDYDEKHLILVEPMMKGVSMDVELDRYAEEHLGDNEFASDHQPLHLKEKYYKILWDFRNATNIKHGDFRPYNVFGDQVIDFGRSEPLSKDLRKRKRQIAEDDIGAREEWEWYYYYSDWNIIEKNPLIPNALNRSKEIFDIYVDRYDDVENMKRYRKAWMDVLTQIHETMNTSIKFPTAAQFGAT